MEGRGQSWRDEWKVEGRAGEMSGVKVEGRGGEMSGDKMKGSRVTVRNGALEMCRAYVEGRA